MFEMTIICTNVICDQLALSEICTIRKIHQFNVFKVIVKEMKTTRRIQLYSQ